VSSTVQSTPLAHRLLDRFLPPRTADAVIGDHI
jgi:hypothetical protein